MNIIINDMLYKLIKTENTDDYIEYEIYKNDCLTGYITKNGAEIYYTARDLDNNVRGCAATIRESLELMLLDMFYSHRYKGDKYIKTLGKWQEGAEISVEYVANDYIKQVTRKVQYNKAAGDLYIVLGTKKYFYYEFK